MPSLDKLVADLIGGDEAAAESAALALGAMGVQATPAVLKLLNSSDAEHRWWAIRTLAASDSPRTEWFVDALRDSSSEVRAAACLALAAHPDARATAGLVAALGDEDGLVGVMAVQALVKAGAAAVPELLRAYEDASASAKINIVRALAELKDHRAIRLMMDAMEADSAALQYWANEGLEKLGLNMVYLRPE